MIVVFHTTTDEHAQLWDDYLYMPFFVAIIHLFIQFIKFLSCDKELTVPWQ